jgi:hypothetical protein
MTKFAESILTELSDDASLAETAHELDPRQLISVLEAAAEADAKAQREAREKRVRLNLLIKVGLARPDVVNRDIARATGIGERAVYKRGHPDQQL